MKLTKYICAIILSLVGNIGFYSCISLFFSALNINNELTLFQYLVLEYDFIFTILIIIFTFLFSAALIVLTFLYHVNNL